ncbi:MAG: hypothetical protein CVU78_05670 [Elusimicrobia bacterium HGW-Elusimicrobia-2]|nr:MAG: hypothetical protein CVU78_05670 [Elusimicrobia bacterium HGW-Elusimicrobia-2]
MNNSKFFVLTVIDVQSDETNIIARLVEKLEEFRDKFFCKDIELIRCDCGEDDNITEKLNNIGQGNKVIIIDTATGNGSSAVLRSEKPGKLKIEKMAETRREFYGYIAKRTFLSILPDIEVIALPQRDITEDEMILLADKTIEIINGIYTETLAAQNRKTKNKWLFPAVFAAGALVSFLATEYYQQMVKNDFLLAKRKLGRQGPSYDEAVNDMKKYSGTIIYWPVTAYRDDIFFYKGSTKKGIGIGSIFDPVDKLHMNMGKHARFQRILGEITEFENGMPVVDVWEVSNNPLCPQFFKNMFNWGRDKQKNKVIYSECDKKLHIALEAFYDKKYEKTISLAEEVLAENDKDALAWKRLGSAYYALGDIKKATLYWERSIKYDPSDEKLKLFVEKIKAEKLKPFKNIKGNELLDERIEDLEKGKSEK